MKAVGQFGLMLIFLGRAWFRPFARLMSIAAYQTGCAVQCCISRRPINEKFGAYEKNACKRNSRRRVAIGHGRWPTTVRSRY